MATGIEWRNAAEFRSAAPGRLVGYAAVYGAWSQDLGGFVERVAPGAFDASLREPDRILALWITMAGMCWAASVRAPCGSPPTPRGCTSRLTFLRPQPGETLAPWSSAGTWRARLSLSRSDRTATPGSTWV